MRRGIRALAVGAAVAVIGMLAAPAAAAPGTTDARATGGLGGGAQASSIFFSDTLAPGASASYNWKNAPAGRVYQVSLSPQGASTTVPCQFEVTRQWYVQRTNLSRVFWWTIKNVGDLACATNMLLTGHDKVASFDLNALNPGQSWNTSWYINTTGVWSMGLSPTGATSTKECHMEVTRSWQEMAGAQLKLRMTVKNTGTIACSTTVLITNTPPDYSYSHQVLDPGETRDSLIATVPVTVAYWSSLTPQTGTNCSLEITREYWVQRIMSGGTTWREYHSSVKNVGAEACTFIRRVDNVEA